MKSPSIRKTFSSSCVLPRSAWLSNSSSAVSRARTSSRKGRRIIWSSEPWLNVSSSWVSGNSTSGKRRSLKNIWEMFRREFHGSFMGFSWMYWDCQWLSFFFWPESQWILMIWWDSHVILIRFHGGFMGFWCMYWDFHGIWDWNFMGYSWFEWIFMGFWQDWMGFTSHYGLSITNHKTITGYQGINTKDLD